MAASAGKPSGASPASGGAAAVGERWQRWGGGRRAAAMLGRERCRCWKEMREGIGSERGFIDDVPSAPLRIDDSNGRGCIGMRWTVQISYSLVIRGRLLRVASLAGVHADRSRNICPPNKPNTPSHCT
jgi:hypothetical protein